MNTKKLYDKLQFGLSKLLRYLFSILMFIFAFVGATELFGSGSFIQLISIILFATLFFYFVIFVHEMGHAIAAWSLGYKVDLIAVGALAFNPGKQKFLIVRNSIDKEIAGFVRYFAPAHLRTRWGENFVSLLGPIATLVLGFGFLYVHSYFGERIEYVDIPKNIHVPKILDGDGRVLLDFGVGPYERKTSHIGFQLLAVVCFLDSVFNLLPLKSGTHHKSDGRNILESFIRPVWTRELWASGQLYNNIKYSQDKVSDNEWIKIRQKYQSIFDAQPNFAPHFLYCAWIKTDPEAYVSGLDHIYVDLEVLTRGTKWQYIACRVLSNGYDESLNALMVEPENEDASIYYFSKAILHYAKGEDDVAVRMVKEARQLYLDKNGVVPAEEEAIFVAIENKLSFPELKWPHIE